MRLVSYNILDGGEGRADPLAEVLLAQQADVVALVECDHLPTLERIATRLSMDFVQGTGNGSCVAVLSRWTIRDSVNHGALEPGLSRAMVEATVVDPAGATWKVAAVHLHARATTADEMIRKRELDIALAKLQGAGPHLLVGDFNANSPVQQIDPARCKPSTQDDWQRNGGHLPPEAVQSLLDRGYVDTLFAKHGNAAGTMYSFTTQHPGQRVDYIFAHGIDSSRVADAWIEQDRLARYASDHFPVGVHII